MKLAVVGNYCNEKARSEIQWFPSPGVLTPSAFELLADAKNPQEMETIEFLGCALRLLTGILCIMRPI